MHADGAENKSQFETNLIPCRQSKYTEIQHLLTGFQRNRIYELRENNSLSKQAGQHNVKEINFLLG